MDPLEEPNEAQAGAGPRAAGQTPRRRVYATGNPAGLMRVLCELCENWLDFETTDQREAIEAVHTHLAQLHPGFPHPGPYPHEQRLLDTPRPRELTESETRRAGRAYSEWRRHCYEAHPRVRTTWEQYDELVRQGAVDPGVRYEVVVRWADR